MNEINITSAKYGHDNSCIIAKIDGIEMTVPLDPDNIHYAEILKQVKEGTLTIKDAD
tara:strand:+ start:67 stop:237 length:171 start_codon:yes stop_codon:yes gene_type:complete